MLRVFQGPTCSASGISLDGNNDYINIASSWQWGGTTSFEAYVKYDNFNIYSRVFDFSNGANSDNIYLANSATTSRIEWSVRQGSTQKRIQTSNFDSFTWTHVVVTVSGTTMKIYKNSALAGTMTDGHEPNVLTRTQHWLGRSAWPDGYFDGTIAYVKMWHGLELTDSDAAFLFSNRELLQFANCELGSGAVSDTVCETCPEGKYSDIDGEGPCTLCPAGRYSDTTGATSCSDCDAGKFSDEGEPSCASCQAGTYVSETTVSLSTCTSCPPGKFSGTAGATSCSECEAGKYTNQGATACVICSYNTFSGSAGQACIACPTGKHISDPGTYPGLGTSADLHDSEDDCVAGNPR